MVAFCNNGFKPKPFAITKSVSVGANGFVIKLTRIRKYSHFTKKSLVKINIFPRENIDFTM